MTETESARSRPGADPSGWIPPPRGSALRAALALPVAMLAAFGIAFGLLAFLLVAPAAARRRHVGWVHAWGRSILKIFGVRLVFHGLDRLREPGAKLVMFNHVSLLDLMVLATVWDRDCTVVYKREFHRVPIIGAVMRRLDLIPIDRGDRERAVESLREAAAMVRSRGARVFLAPEGTRSRRGGLQEFKLGPFHLAAQTGAPILPCVMRGIEPLNPVGSWLIRAGTVRVDFLPPIPTAAWTEDGAREHAEAVRAEFLRLLPPAPAA